MHLLLGMSSWVKLLYIHFKQIFMTEVKHSSQLLVFSAWDITDMGISVKDSHRIMVLGILVLTNQMQLGTNLQLAKNDATFVMRKTCYIATQKEFFLLFNLHNDKNLKV